MQKHEPANGRMGERTKYLAVAMFAAVVGLISTVAFAQTNYWVNNGGLSGTFNDGSASSQWDITAGGPGGAPAPGTTNVVAFDNNQLSPYTVRFNADIQTSAFHVPT